MPLLITVIASSSKSRIDKAWDDQEFPELASYLLSSMLWKYRDCKFSRLREYVLVYIFQNGVFKI